MKFHDLAIGQRFELEGEHYVKTSPVLAGKVEGGTSRFLARYVAVRLLDDNMLPPSSRQEILLPEGRVRAAFEDFHAHCHGMLDQLAAELSGNQLATLRQDLEEGRRNFFAALDSAVTPDRLRK